MTTSCENWVFLGDSLTEGIGASRDNYVSELARSLRDDTTVSRPVHDIRLRDVNPLTFNPYIQTNLAGFLDADRRDGHDALWLWNLASEGRFVDDDQRWLPLLSNLAPRRVFIYRGSLESIIRPAAVFDKAWPAWVPRGWRGLVTLDPRCFFSRGGARRIKQVVIDDLKQRARRRLLLSRPGRSLYDAATIDSHYVALLEALRPLGAAIYILGLVAPDEDCFPGSAAQFARVNDRLRAIAPSFGAEFIDWGVDGELARAHTWRCRDGFHPTRDGAQVLARILRRRLNADAAGR